jgi:hypothetical protein
MHVAAASHDKTGSHSLHSIHNNLAAIEASG